MSLYEYLTYHNRADYSPSTQKPIWWTGVVPLCLALGLSSKTDAPEAMLQQMPTNTLINISWGHHLALVRYSIGCETICFGRSQEFSFVRAPPGFIICIQTKKSLIDPGSIEANFHPVAGSLLIALEPRIIWTSSSKKQNLITRFIYISDWTFCVREGLQKRSDDPVTSIKTHYGSS